MKRLFLGITIPEEITTLFEDYLEIYKQDQHLRESKWTSRENLHFTVLFIGDIPENVVPDVQTMIRGVVSRASPFTLEFEHIEFFSYKVPKMIWARFKRNLGFLELNQECKKFLNPYMSESDDGKEPIPHVTLARLRQVVDPKKFSFKPLTVPAIEVRQLCLFESKLTPAGPIYTVIDSYEF